MTGFRCNNNLKGRPLPKCPFCGSVKLCEHFVGWSWDEVVVSAPYQERVPGFSVIAEGSRTIKTTGEDITTYRVYGVLVNEKRKEIKPRSKREETQKV